MQDELRKLVENYLYVHNLTQTELARRAGVSRATISDFLSGKRNAGIDLCRGLAIAVEHDEAYIYQMAGLMSEPKFPINIKNPRVKELSTSVAYKLIVL